MLFLLGFLLPFAAFVVAQDTNLQTVKNAFEQARIPQDIDVAFNPTALLEVTFPQGTQFPITLHAGEQLPRNATVGPPFFSLISSHSSGPFVVAAIDPDAPTPQNTSASQVRHFLGGNFTPLRIGRFDTPLLINSTAAVTEFIQPAPPAESDPHRYIFLVFNQPEGFNEQTLVTPETDILNFNLSVFADAVGLGDPIAGTYMLVGPDPQSGMVG